MICGKFQNTWHPTSALCIQCLRILTLLTSFFPDTFRLWQQKIPKIAKRQKICWSLNRYELWIYKHLEWYIKLFPYSMRQSNKSNAFYSVSRFWLIEYNIIYCYLTIWYMYPKELWSIHRPALLVLHFQFHSILSFSYFSLVCQQSFDHHLEINQLYDVLQPQKYFTHFLVINTIRFCCVVA